MKPPIDNQLSQQAADRTAGEEYLDILDRLEELDSEIDKKIGAATLDAADTALDQAGIDGQIDFNEREVKLALAGRLNDDQLNLLKEHQGLSEQADLLEAEAARQELEALNGDLEDIVNRIDLDRVCEVIDYKDGEPRAEMVLVRLFETAHIDGMASMSYSILKQVRENITEVALELESHDIFQSSDVAGPGKPPLSESVERANDSTREYADLNGAIEALSKFPSASEKEALALASDILYVGGVFVGQHVNSPALERLRQSITCMVVEKAKDALEGVAPHRLIHTVESPEYVQYTELCRSIDVDDAISNIDIAVVTDAETGAGDVWSTTVREKVLLPALKNMPPVALKHIRSVHLRKLDKHELHLDNALGFVVHQEDGLSDIVINSDLYWEMYNDAVRKDILQNHAGSNVDEVQVNAIIETYKDMIDTTLHEAAHVWIRHVTAADLKTWLDAVERDPSAYATSYVKSRYEANHPKKYEEDFCDYHALFRRNEDLTSGDFVGRASSMATAIVRYCTSDQVASVFLGDGSSST